MSYASYLTLKPQLAEFRSGSDGDTMSEVSDSGTGGSTSSAMGTAEELQKISLILNIPTEDLTQDRFRVDRTKLESMLGDDINQDESANTFFRKIMDETNTFISWPMRLKVGAKSKKDPHVRVTGKVDSVKMAKDKIMNRLDTRCNRVTMKLDVSYTDHSHIIGKGGLTIKRVMDETNCHIHFPDSNRSNPMEKSNQVSIAGDMPNVEKAREKLRNLTPLIFCFELPIMSSSQPVPDANSAYVINIQEKYNVQVMLRTRPKLHATLVMVKGQQWEVQATMEATTLLIKYMCGSLAQQTLVQMSVEITPMHHATVMGRGAHQLRAIMANTKAQIMFPDATDPNVPMLKKSNVTITGQIKEVYLARQQLIGSLPLVIMFDLPEETKDVQAEQLTNLMQKLNVFITIRHKPKLGTYSVVIKGVERNARDIYEARRHLLNTEEPLVTACIPESYHIPILPGTSEPLSLFNPFSPSHLNTIPQSPMNIAAPLQNLAKNASRTYSLPPLPLSDLSNIPGLHSPQFNPPTPGGYPSPMSPLLSPSIFNPSWSLIPPSPQGQSNGNIFQYPNGTPTNSPNYMSAPQQPTWNIGNQGTNMLSHMQPHQIIQQFAHSDLHMHHGVSSSQPNSLGMMSSQGSSGYQSNFTGSSVSLDVHSVSGNESSNGGSNFVSPSVSPIGKTQSPNTIVINDQSNNDIAHILSEVSEENRRAPGFEKKIIENLQSPKTPMGNYTQLKEQASKAMKESCDSERYRVPTNRWVGYGFSQTSPSQFLSPNLQNQGGSSVWGDNNYSQLKRPNISEPSIPSPRTPVKNEQPSCHYQQLSQLLAERGLDKYIQMFRSHEVDITTFITLTDSDLMEIGVTAFGARKKMLLIIADIQKNNTIFNGSAAPGAERKTLRI